MYHLACCHLTLWGIIFKYIHLHVKWNTMRYLYISKSHLPTVQHNRSPSSFNCHLLQFVTIHSIPLTRRLTALGPHWGESNGLWAQLCVPNWMAHPFVKYTFSNKNWQRNLISIQGAAEALSLEKINCYPLSDCAWQFLNRLDKGFIISPWNSHIEISDKQCNRKGTRRAADKGRVGRVESMESRLKQHETSSDKTSIFSVLTSLRSKNDKIS